MHEKSKKYIIIGIILFINAIFAYKYIDRYTNHIVLIMVPLVTFYFFVLKGACLQFSKRTFFFLSLITLVLFIIFSIIILNKISVGTLKVDRWSIINEFWNYAFQNKYPYNAESFDGNPPGPMPIYFILALPFYLLGELGYLPIIGVLIFTSMLYLNGVAPKNLFFAIIFIASSIFSLWEVVTRSNIFFNSVLILLVLDNFIKLEKRKKSLFYVNAILAGLLLSTRSFFIIPYIIFFIGTVIRKEMRFNEIFNYGIISVLTFVFSFLPLILFFPEDFFEMNPFYVQSSFFIPTIYIIGFIVLATLLSFISKSKYESIFLGGIAMFISILVYFLYYIASYGIETAYIESKADISYFIFCVPFLLYYYYREKTMSHETLQM